MGKVHISFHKNMYAKSKTCADCYEHRGRYYIRLDKKKADGATLIHELYHAVCFYLKRKYDYKGDYWQNKEEIEAYGWEWALMKYLGWDDHKIIRSLGGISLSNKRKKEFLRRVQDTGEKFLGRIK